MDGRKKNIWDGCCDAVKQHIAVNTEILENEVFWFFLVVAEGTVLKCSSRFDSSRINYDKSLAECKNVHDHKACN